MIIFYVQQVSNVYYRVFSLQMNSYYDLPGWIFQQLEVFTVAENVYIPSAQLPPVLIDSSMVYEFILIKYLA